MKGRNLVDKYLVSKRCTIKKCRHRVNTANALIHCYSVRLKSTASSVRERGRLRPATLQASVAEKPEMSKKLESVKKRGAAKRVPRRREEEIQLCECKATDTAFKIAVLGRGILAGSESTATNRAFQRERSLANKSRATPNSVSQIYGEGKFTQIPKYGLHIERRPRADLSYLGSDSPGCGKNSYRGCLIKLKRK